MTIIQWELRRAAMGQNGIRVLMCDDDPGFSGVLQEMIEKVMTRMNIGVTFFRYHCPEEISQEHMRECDLAFLDIDFENDNQNGIDVARSLRRENNRVRIFFVTNYIDYAPAGYEVQAFRYILKRDLPQTLERYILQAVETMAEAQTLLRIRCKEETVDLPLAQIGYIEVLDHSVSIHAGVEIFTITATLSAMESALGSHGFLRIHKSYLVNMSHIRKFRSRECILKDGTVLSVSEKNYSQQKQKYLLWKGLV